MSFSYDVKKELCSGITDKDKQYACLYGMLLFCKQFSFEQITLQTEHELSAKLFETLANHFTASEAVSCAETSKRNGTVVYTLTISDADSCRALTSLYHISTSAELHRIKPEILETISIPDFLAGGFLSCGSVIDPNKEYHLEFVAPYYNLSRDLYAILEKIGLAVKYTERKGVHVLYMKDSESIEDTLTFMGATLSSLDIMNIKILKDVRNKTNRIANCDIANIEKAINAAGKQISDIELIERTIGFGGLTKELREIAEMRLENPELSLRELGQALPKPIGRSGVNHRMMKLAAIADNLRNQSPN